MAHRAPGRVDKAGAVVYNAPGAASEVVGAISATTSAEGHRIMIQAPAGFERDGRSAEAEIAVDRGASARLRLNLCVEPQEPPGPAALVT